MSLETEDGVTMIGLHPLDQPASDGFQALCLRSRNQWASWNVVAFPSDLVRAPGVVLETALGPDAENGGNVVVFRPRLSRGALKARDRA